MNVSKIGAICLATALASPFCQAGNTGTIRFIGQVVEGGCWNTPGQNDIVCLQHNEIVRHRMDNVDKLTIAARKATVTKTFIDKEKRLEVLEIVYN